MKNFKFNFLNKKINSLRVKNFGAKPNFDNFTSTNQRLDNKARNTGSSANQIQNYERNILIKKRNDYADVDADNFNMRKDVDSIFDNLESTNSDFLKNIDDTNPIAVPEMSYEDFIRESEKFFEILRKAFYEVVAQDKNINLENDRRRIVANVKGTGTYTIIRENETKLIVLTSPLSGLFKYKFDPLSRYWISIKDSHILEELLVREFCQHSKGLLLINQ